MKVVFFEVESWEKEILQKDFPDAVLVAEKLSPDLAVQHQDAEIISCFVYSDCHKDTLEKLPNLKLIATRSTGMDHIDSEYCKSRNITVANVPEYGSRTVAEYTFALLLSLTRKIYESAQQSKACLFDHHAITGTDIFGKTIGIVGLGKIGLEVLKISQGFGMKPLVFARHPDEALKQQYGVEFVDLPALLQRSDIITLHMPYTPETHHIINSQNLVLCKPGTILINTARGGLLETDAILMGLEKGTLGGVGLDVLEEENNLGDELSILSSHNPNKADYKTMCMDHVLMHHPKALVTPHNAFNSREALNRILQTTIATIKTFNAK